jgi:hypothetical protein
MNGRCTVSPEQRTGDDRCWPCTVGNATVGLVVGWFPLIVVVLGNRAALVPLTAGWAVLVTAYTGHRLYQRGYLPYAESVAIRIGIHDRIGPGADSGDEESKQQ